MRYLEQLGRHLMLLGVPGLFIVSLLDSAAIPMAGGPDTLIVLLSWQKPAHAALIAVVAAVGSTIGCLVLYRIGRAGGERVLAHMARDRRERLARSIERNSVWAIFISVVAPPPFPTKPAILAAGAFSVSLGRFIPAVLTGRLLRFGILAFLGARFGDQTARIVRHHALYILLAAALALVLVFAIRRARRPTNGS